jgi:alkylation response protein AidB-like acyl-CoA dehydrogenase
MVPPTINKYYAVDLAPGRSLIEHLVASGQQVFVMSWRNPDVRHAEWGLDSYARAVLEALDATGRVSHTDQTVLLGMCSGGIIASLVAGHLAGTGTLGRLAGLVLPVTVLDNERAGLGAAAAAGVRIALEDLKELARERGVVDDPVIRQRLAQLTIEVELLRLNSWRGLTQIMKRGVPGPEGSLPKWQWSDVNQALTELAVDILGEDGAAWDSPWTYRLLRSRANSIEGGTTEILKNIIAERVLGLPKLR